MLSGVYQTKLPSRLQHQDTITVKSMAESTKKRRVELPGDASSSATVGFGSVDRLPLLVDLPDECLLTLYEQLSICDQRRLGATNSRLRALMLKAFRGRKTLTIVQGIGDPMKLIWKAEYRLADKVLYEDEVRGRSAFSALYLGREQLHADTINWLFGVFPTITELSLALQYITADDSRQVITLLNRLAPTMVTLKLYVCTGISNRSQENQCLYNLFSTVNSMPKLKHFTFYATWSLKGAFTAGGQTAAIHLPILGQLETFNFHYADNPTDLEDTLRQFALPNSSLTARIAVISRHRPGVAARPIDPQLARYFKRCRIEIETPIPQGFYSAFTSLTNVSVYLEEGNGVALNYRQLLEALVDLKQLHYLAVCPNLDHRTNRFLRADVNSAHFPVLPSVKMFQFTIIVLRHLNLRKALKVEHCYPKLESLVVNVDDCANCHSFNEEMGSFDLSNEAGQKCARRWIKSLQEVQVPQKRVAFCQANRKYITYEEVLAK